VRGVIKKWGNGTVVRIPSSVLEAAHVRLDHPVDEGEEAGRVVIEPLEPTHYSIEALVAGITDENRHDPVEMGKPVGQEAWLRRRATSRTPATSSGCDSVRGPDANKPDTSLRSCSARRATMDGSG